VTALGRRPDLRVLVITGTGAHWGLPEVRSSGGVSRLTRLVGTHSATWMAWAGQNVTAADARTIGIVHTIYPAEAFMDEVYAFARSLIALGPEVSGLAKLTIDLCDPQDREKARQVERMANTELSHMRVGQVAADYAGPAYRARRSPGVAGRPDPAG
jgi:enoyl-CoA hydratase/carnithine racemase